MVRVSKSGPRRSWPKVLETELVPITKVGESRHTEKGRRKGGVLVKEAAMLQICFSQTLIVVYIYIKVQLGTAMAVQGNPTYFLDHVVLPIPFL